MSYAILKEKDYDFTGLEVWQRAHQLMIHGYGFCKLLPKSENYGRVSQLRRALSSVPANIAEGHGRYYYLENVQFCRRARGSLYEVKNHLIAARDLGEAPKEECDRLIKECDRIRQILNGYIRYLLRTKIGIEEYALTHNA